MNDPENQLVVATATQSTTTFPFLDLPPEIRNMIYRYLLKSAKPIKPPGFQTLYELRVRLSKDNRVIRDNKLGIACVCRQIKDEALAFYFGSNTFKFSYVQNMATFLYSIGGERRKHIRNISFDYSGLEAFEAFILLGKCANLKQLHVNASMETMKGSRLATRDDLTTAPGLKKLLEIRGCTEVTVSYGSIYGPYFGRHSEDNFRKFENLLKTELCKERLEPAEQDKKKPKASKDNCKETKKCKLSGKGKKGSGVVAKAAKAKARGKKALTATFKATKARLKDNDISSTAPKIAK
jgi:hypothetical protein